MNVATVKDTLSVAVNTIWPGSRSGGELSVNNLSQTQESGTNLEIGAFRGAPVHLKSDMPLIHREIDHAPGGREPVRLTGGENADGRKRRDYGSCSFALRRTDEKDLARVCLSGFGNPQNAECPVPDLFPPHGLVQCAVKGIGAENADCEGIALIPECRGRPFHKSGEVKEERRFDVILIGDLTCRGHPGQCYTHKSGP